MKHIINGEYTHHQCDCCGAKGKGTPWVVYSPFFIHPSWSEDSSTPPTGWGHVSVPYKNKGTVRCDLCSTCIAAGKTAKDVPPDF